MLIGDSKAYIWCGWHRSQKLFYTDLKLVFFMLIGDSKAYIWCKSADIEKR